MKIAHKFILFILVPVVVSVVLLSIGLYHLSSKALKEEMDRNLFHTARHIQNMIEGEIEKVKGDLVTFLANNSLEEYFMYLNIREMDYVEDARATLEEYLLKIASSKPNYPTLRIFSRDGKGIVNITDIRASHIYPDPTKTDWFNSAFGLAEGESFLSEVYSCIEHQFPSIFVSQPYYYRGKLMAVGVIHLHTQDIFGKILSHIRIGKTGYAYLVDSRGVVIAHKDQQMLGVDLSQLGTSQAVIKGEVGTQIEKNMYRGILEKKSYLPFNIRGAGIVVSQSLEEAMAVSTGVKWYAVSISGVVTVGLLLLIFFTSRQIVIRPVKALSSATQRLLKGDLTARVELGTSTKCWDIRQCGQNECPAYNSQTLACWYIADTQCPNCDHGEYVDKIGRCLKCDVYRRIAGDEIQELSHVFNLMALSLNEYISGLEKTEKKVREQRRLLQTILDATPDFVSLQDRDLTYRAANKSFCHTLSRTEEDIVGKTNYQLFSADNAESYQKEDLEILTSGLPLFKEYQLGRKAKSRWLHVMKTPVYDGKGQRTGLLCSCRDITELKKMQEQLTQAQKMETVGQLTAGIAHEINTPLGIILGYTQLLLEDVEPGNQVHQDLTTIVKQTKICRKIVTDLLSFSRLTEGTSSLVDLNQPMAEVISVVEHTFRLNHVFIATDFGTDLPLLRCDVEKLKQVFVNLLNNAHDAIGADGTIHIKTEFAVADNEVAIYIADTGKGIPPNKIDRIFDPFYTTKPVDKGTGLGLTVTFGIIKEHGGKIEVESPPVSFTADGGPLEKGTLFIIHLPVDEID